MLAWIASTQYRKLTKNVQQDLEWLFANEIAMKVITTNKNMLNKKSTSFTISSSSLHKNSKIFWWFSQTLENHSATWVIITKQKLYKNFETKITKVPEIHETSKFWVDARQHIDSNLSKKKFFWGFSSNVRHCPKLQSCTISSKTNDATLRN